MPKPARFVCSSRPSSSRAGSVEIAIRGWLRGVGESLALMVTALVAVTVGCGEPPELVPESSAAIPPLWQEVRAKVEATIEESGAEISVAFRTLEGELELLIAPDRVYHAASTMKVPVLIELYRQATDGEIDLDGELEITNEFASIVDDSTYSLTAAEDSEQELYTKIGQRIDIRWIAEAMITRSSNLATNLLIETLGVERIRATVEKLGASGMEVLRGVEDIKAFRAGLSNQTTAPALLVLMEALAKGEAVNPEASAEMVEILGRQHFAEGIPAGLPEGLEVAHKTGNITRIHHDAGIVRAPRPYVLVVLVRGIDSAEESGRVIAEISRIVYQASQRDRFDGSNP